jgi:hypothetical protein
MFSVWNHLVRKGRGVAPIDTYRASIEATKERQRLATKQVMIDAFWFMPGEVKRVRGIDADGNKTTVQAFEPETYEYTNEGIKIQYEKQKYSFITDSPDFNSKYQTKRFCVKFDKKNPSEVYLYENTEKGIVPFLHNNTHMSLANPEVFHQALADREPGEALRLHAHLAKKDEQLAIVQAKVKELERANLLNGVAGKLTAGNAFPKKVIALAKQSVAEQLINGEAFSLVEAPKSLEEKHVFDPLTEPITESEGELEPVLQTINPVNQKITPWYMQE